MYRRGGRRVRAHGGAGVVAIVALVALVVVPAGEASRLPKPFKLYTYKVQSEGSGTYTHQDGPVDVRASFDWKVTMKSLVLLPKSLSSKPGSGGLRQAGVAIGQQSSDGITGSWDASVTGTPPCHGSGGFEPAGPPEATAYLNPLVKGGYVIDVLPSNAATPINEKPKGAQDCADIGGPLTSDFWHDWPENEGAGDNAPELEESVHLKPSREGKVVQHVEVDGSEKPRSNCMCTFDWKGTVTLTRTKVTSVP